MRKHPKRIHVNPAECVPWGTSDQNGMIGPRPKMGFQREWRGNKIVPLNILVHPDEKDIPNRQLGSLMLSPDPPPKRNARPEQYAIDEASLIITDDGSALITESSGTAILDAPITPP